ncbi:LacI family DNA-binding transcriptional regulator [Streptomyces lasiicapitis]|uniref:LacI family DNA-binding transcriptional regulator n=1 Tax=Streptomyces lasiicapitis TaxID=1923961 RepID=UPI0033196E96
MPDSGPTLADIARAAEVSTATVSHALNGTGRLSEATRRRVRATATALGYGAPRTGPRTRTLGIAVTTFPGPWNYTEIAYFSRAVTAATAAAHAHGYALTTLPADRVADAAWHTLAVDGMLIVDSPPGDPMARACAPAASRSSSTAPPATYARTTTGSTTTTPPPPARSSATSRPRAPAASPCSRAAAPRRTRAW